jgi:hypothetical protein
MLSGPGVAANSNKGAGSIVGCEETELKLASGELTGKTSVPCSIARLLVMRPMEDIRRLHGKAKDLASESFTIECYSWAPCMV